MSAVAVVHSEPATTGTPDGGRAAYVREARRLRSRLGDQPEKLHDALRALARRHDQRATPCGVRLQPNRHAKSLVAARVISPDAVRVVTSSPASRFMDVPAALGPTVRRVEQFVEMVRDAFDGPVLLYSRRQVLLAQAARMGISRFDAGLIIASVQHGGVGHVAAGADRSRAGGMPWPARLGWALLIQCGVAALLWWVVWIR